jgi:hypothetical protein
LDNNQIFIAGYPKMTAKVFELSEKTIGEASYGYRKMQVAETWWWTPADGVIQPGLNTLPESGQAGVRTG